MTWVFVNELYLAFGMDRQYIFKRQTTARYFGLLIQYTAQVSQDEISQRKLHIQVALHGSTGSTPTGSTNRGSKTFRKKEGYVVADVY